MQQAIQASKQLLQWMCSRLGRLGAHLTPALLRPLKSGRVPVIAPCMYTVRGMKQYQLTGHLEL